MSEQPDRPTADDREAWNTYWTAQGMPWRTEPEIDEEKQTFLVKRQAIEANIEKGIYPLGGIRLTRADVEWLLATHDYKGIQGPVNLNEEQSQWAALARRFGSLPIEESIEQYIETSEQVIQQRRLGPDMRGANLRDVDLHGLPLARAGFRSTELSDANLSQAELEEAWLNDANLCRANLRNMNAYGARLLGADLTSADLTGANLCSADLSGAILRSATLRAANLENARLVDTNLQEADLREARLNMASF